MSSKAIVCGPGKMTVQALYVLINVFPAFQSKISVVWCYKCCTLLELTPLVGPTLKNVVSSRVSKICQPLAVCGISYSCFALRIHKPSAECWLYEERFTESCILGVKLCYSFILYAFKICTFYANLKHGKQVRIGWIPSLKSENVSHLGQNSFALHECCRSNWLQGRPFLRAPVPTQQVFSQCASLSLFPSPPQCSGLASEDCWGLQTPARAVCPHHACPAAPFALQHLTPLSHALVSSC